MGIIPMRRLVMPVGFVEDKIRVIVLGILVRYREFNLQYKMFISI
jgi:hypothetical protein